jgi:hypothetical protein
LKAATDHIDRDAHRDAPTYVAQCVAATWTAVKMLFLRKDGVRLEQDHKRECSGHRWAQRR